MKVTFGLKPDVLAWPFSFSQGMVLQSSTSYIEAPVGVLA
jgi:hypothetical protein